MDFYETKHNISFKRDIYRCHCLTIDENGFTFENIITLRGFNFSTVEECLSDFVNEHYDVTYYDYNIVTDIANKLVILTIKGEAVFREVTIDKIERIQNEEE